jgi:hypothetical protein
MIISPIHQSNIAFAVRMHPKQNYADGRDFASGMSTLSTRAIGCHRLPPEAFAIHAGYEWFPPLGQYTASHHARLRHRPRPHAQKTWRIIHHVRYRSKQITPHEESNICTQTATLDGARAKAPGNKWNSRPMQNE